jgi:hypothetical protein
LALDYVGRPEWSLCETFRLNDNFTLGTMTDISSGFIGYQYERGFGHLAVPRGGSVIGNAISGTYKYRSQNMGFRIRLPD